MVKTCPPILIPSTFTQLTINKLSSSAASTNENREIGHPCLIFLIDTESRRSTMCQGYTAINVGVEGTYDIPKVLFKPKQL